MAKQTQYKFIDSLDGSGYINVNYIVAFNRAHNGYNAILVNGRIALVAEDVMLKVIELIE